MWDKVFSADRIQCHLWAQHHVTMVKNYWSFRGACRLLSSILEEKAASSSKMSVIITVF